MSRVCELTGKSGQTGNTRSNANNKTRTKSFANMRHKRFFVPELKEFVRVRLSNRAIRTVDKLGGLYPACKRYEKTLSPRLIKFVNRVTRKMRSTQSKKAA